MAEIKAFRPLRYTEKAGAIENNVCPPYDIVDAAGRARLCEASPYNLIRLELPEGDGNDKYREAGRLLREFTDNGILAQDESEGMFIYEEEFEFAGETKTLDGLVCLCKTYDFSEKIVLPHEETLSKAKKDRFDLMSETFCNFSSVYSLYSDGKDTSYLGGVFSRFKSETPLVEFTDGEGIIHRLWKIADPEALADITSHFAPERLFIADGHHRYETSGLFNKYCVENGIEADSGYIMMTIVDMESDGLVVLPTHRLVVGMDIDAEAIIEKAAEDFTVSRYDDVSAMTEALEAASDGNAFAMYTGGGVFRLLVLKEARMVASSAVKELDVSVLHDLVLEKLLGIDKANMAAQKNLRYTRSAEEAIEAVDTGKASAAFILNPTKVSQIKKVALEGSKMPQKSTYFYPKLITGLLINRFRDINK